MHGLTSSVSHAPITVHRNEGVVLPTRQDMDTQFSQLMNSCPDSRMIPTYCRFAHLPACSEGYRPSKRLQDRVLRLGQVITFVKVLKLVQTWSAWWQQRRINIEAAVLGRDGDVSMVQNKLNTTGRTGESIQSKRFLYIPFGSISQQESCHTNVQLARFGARKG